MNAAPEKTNNTNVESTDFDRDLSVLWALTKGTPEVCVAVLDGPVDLSHSSFRNAQLEIVKTPITSESGAGAEHGTQVASVIFGGHDGPVRGIAPHCRGLIVPIFSVANGQLQPCSQDDLARGILRAVENGADVINISAGQFAPSGKAFPLLEEATRVCMENDVLIVASAGNDGCACSHLPAALPNSLAIGAMDHTGEPLDFSNWSESYREHGVLAPGENILVASTSNGVHHATGTSFATPIAAGIVALLLSLQKELYGATSVARVLDAVLASAIDCNVKRTTNCPRLLKGRLNVVGAVKQLFRGETIPMTTEYPIQPSPYGSVSDSHSNPNPAVVPMSVDTDHSGSSTIIAEETASHGVAPAGCGCNRAAQAAPEFVYAMGQIDYTFATDLRHDSYQQLLNADPDVHQNMVDHLRYEEKGRAVNIQDATGLTWLLTQEMVPIYAIQPAGPFSELCFDELIDCLERQILEPTDANRIERVIIPGVIAGTETLANGQQIPVIRPELRGMSSWSKANLIERVLGSPPEVDESKKSTAKSQREARERLDDYRRRADGIGNFLERVYYEMRNFGRSSSERALNCVATNAYGPAKVFEMSLDEEMVLESFQVEPSPLCRPGADCWDVVMTFFDPTKRYERAKRVFRIGVNVGEVLPVTIGEVRSWYVH